ncbi:glycosyltransferase family 4 protein [Breoghania sp. L-A4]|uniref:glycosyltransferase family 4 protein n=1 Tax=Breoghania sp. L-A4 TaxID=2304600 RepID=UPI000E35CAD1|nr:glycosyltransferase family 4 protein [Breoghania sp. L-A4]AXS40969.1 glycosyltransferase family 1 protein [Breoghania sp. L-A4]
MNTTPYRIVHCIRAPVGGAFRHVCDLVRAQNAAGHSVGLICASDTDDAFAEEKLARLESDLKLGLIRMPMRRSLSLGDLSAIWRVLRQLHGLAPDILHGHGAKGGAYARLIGTAMRARGASVKRFYSPHGGSLHFAKDSAAGKVFFTLERTMERMTDGLIFVSRYEETQYREKIHAPKVPNRVIHNGLRPDEFQPVIPAADAADFLFIGEMRHLKGPDVFLRALAMIHEQTGRCPTAHLVGPGAQVGEYKEQADQLGLGEHVSFHPPMPARQAFAMARCVAIPSRAESMPYIVLETVAAAMPLITTRVGGIPEIFEGREGDLVEPDDDFALAAAMREKMQAPEHARAIAVLHQNILSAGFSLDHMARAVFAFYGGASRPAAEDRPQQVEDISHIHPLHELSEAHTGNRTNRRING